MSEQLDELLTVFGRRMRGRVIRNQKVEYAELLIDNITCNDGECRYMLFVVLESPFSYSEEEGNDIMDVIYNEIPDAAFAMTTDRDKLMKWMRFEEEPEWLLEDEIELS